MGKAGISYKNRVHLCTERITEKMEMLTLNQYIEEKLKMLSRDFKIKPSLEEKAHMYELTSEIAVDNYAHTLLIKYL